MFEKFTPRAIEVMEIAKREALSMKHGSISSEHILLGLVRENNGVAHHILAKFGYYSKTLRIAIGKLVEEGKWVGSGPMSLTTDAKKIVEVAYSYASEWNHEYVGTEHLLASIVHDSNHQSVAATCLAANKLPIMNTIIGMLGLVEEEEIEEHCGVESCNACEKETFCKVVQTMKDTAGIVALFTHENAQEMIRETSLLIGKKCKQHKQRE